MMETSPRNPEGRITSNIPASQHGPRPLPLFLAHLWRETENNPDLRRKSLIGLRKYQQIKRPDANRHHHVAAQSDSSRLLAIGAQRPHDNRPIVVLIPSLINSHLILDLSDTQSLAHHLLHQGFAPYLVDWGRPAEQTPNPDLDGHIIDQLVPLVLSLNRPVHLLGYCLGGTLTIGAAHLLAARGCAPTSVTTIATPWYFNAYPDDDLRQIKDIWEQHSPLCERLDLVPMEVLQQGFWALDPQRTIAKYAAFAEVKSGSVEETAFLAVEDWANEGAPLSYEAGRQLFRDFYGANAPGSGQWVLDEYNITPQTLPCPSLSICSISDRIVPANAAPDANNIINSDLGHVGMIVSRSAPQKIWQPLSDWLSNPSC